MERMKKKVLQLEETLNEMDEDLIKATAVICANKFELTEQKLSLAVEK